MLRATVKGVLARRFRLARRASRLDVLDAIATE
jgi:hypothetical protein